MSIFLYGVMSPSVSVLMLVGGSGSVNSFRVFLVYLASLWSESSFLIESTSLLYTEQKLVFVPSGSCPQMYKESRKLSA